MCFKGNKLTSGKTQNETVVTTKRVKRKRQPNTLLTNSLIQRTSRNNRVRFKEVGRVEGGIHIPGENASRAKRVTRGGLGRQSLLTSQQGGIGFYNKDA